MFKFELDIRDNKMEINISKMSAVGTYHIYQELTTLEGADFIFRFDVWVKNWLNERALFDCEYETYIRLH